MKNDFADYSHKDLLDVAIHPYKFHLERAELYALLKELAFRLRTLKSCVDRF